MEEYEKFLAKKDGAEPVQAAFQIHTVKELSTPEFAPDSMEIDDGEENVRNLLKDSMKREQVG